MKSTSPRQKCRVPLALGWSHQGIPYRVTPWPEARFEKLYGTDWIPVAPAESVLASAAQSCGEREWAVYLDFVPGDVREFLRLFTFARMEALQVVARCPGLLGDLAATPVLTAFIAAHTTLRGGPAPRWGEVSAVHERGGVFGILEWLGLPASRQALAILRQFAEPDLAKRFLEPLRTLLWEPHVLFALQRIPAITDRQLAQFCHPLAA